MKELAQLRIQDANPKIKLLSSEEIDEKIELYYSYGYIYNPYIKQFYNPFIEKKLMAILIMNDIENIKKLLEHFENFYIVKNNVLRNYDKVEKDINGNGKVSRVGLMFEGYVGTIGFYILILSIILYLINEITFSVSCGIISFIFISYYFTTNLFFENNESGWQLSAHWKKSQHLYTILTILMYPYIYWLLYLITNSFWIPLIIIIPLKYAIEFFVIKKLSRQFLQMVGINSFHKFASERGLI